MKTQSLIVIVFLLLLYSSLQAQEIGISVGYGTYNMKSLKALNDDLASSNIDIPLKVVDNFPSFINMGVHAVLDISKQFGLGGDISFNSTGSRLAYNDYSGSIYIDQKISAFHIAALPSLILMSNNKSLFTLDTRLGVSVNSLRLNSTLRLDGDVSEDSKKFSSINWFLEPGIRYRRVLIGPMAAAVRISYHITPLQGKLYFEDSNDMHLLAHGKPAVTDWSGVRGELSINYVLK